MGLRGGMGDAALIGHGRGRARGAWPPARRGCSCPSAAGAAQAPDCAAGSPHRRPHPCREIYAAPEARGKLQETHGRSPFELPPPSLAFAVELHGFGWLRHLSAADSDSPAPTPGRWCRTGSRSARAPPPRSLASRRGGAAHDLLAQPDAAACSAGPTPPSTAPSCGRSPATPRSSKRARAARAATELKLLIQLALTH